PDPNRRPRKRPHTRVIRLAMKLLPVISLVFVATLSAAPELAIQPPSAKLSGPEAWQQFLAEATEGSYQRDWTRQAVWSSSNPLVAPVDKTGMVKPVADGEATITATANGVSASARVQIRNAKAPFAWSFRNDVAPVMTKMGCNQGACHGA